MNMRIMCITFHRRVQLLRTRAVIAIVNIPPLGIPLHTIQIGQFTDNQELTERSHPMAYILTFYFNESLFLASLRTKY